MTDDPVEFDPDHLSPASRAALKRIQIVWLLTVLAITIAFTFIVTQTHDGAACVARQYAWDIEYQSAQRQNVPLPTDGYHGELLRARVQANVVRAANLRAFKVQARPEC